MTRIVVLGPPGSGKGTQARLLAARVGVPHLSVGGLLRAEIAHHSSLGDRVAATVSAGQLVGIGDVVAVLRGPLAAASAVGGWVLDGAPRNVQQAAALADLIEGPGPGGTTVLALDVPEDELRRRLRQRSTSEARADDVPQVISRRLSVWAKDGPPLLAWYEHRGSLVRVDGWGAVDTVAARVAAAIDRTLRADP